MGTTKRRKFWTALTNNEHKVTLVHSKHHGWLAIGLTFFAMGTAGIALSSQGQVVHASDQQLQHSKQRPIRAEFGKFVQ